MTSLEEIKKALEAAEQFIVNGVERGYIRMPDPETPDSAHDTLPMIRQAQTALESLQSENEELRDLTAHLRLQAQTHAMEARGANATIHEIYQIISGGKGEPGNWRGSKPVREYVESAKGEILRFETELALSKPIYSRRQLEARMKLLEEALTPFGREGEKWHEMWPDDHIPAVHPKGNVCGSCGAEPDCDVARFTVGDLRRARQALASTGGEHHAE